MDFVTREEYCKRLQEVINKKCWSAGLGVCNALLLCFGERVPRRVALPDNGKISHETLRHRGEYELVTNLSFWRLSEISRPSFNQTNLEDDSDDSKFSAIQWLDRLKGAIVKDVIFCEPFLDLKLVLLDNNDRIIYLDIFCIADKGFDSCDAFHYFFPDVTGGYTVRFDGSIIVGRS